MFFASAKREKKEFKRIRHKKNRSRLKFKSLGIKAHESVEGGKEMNCPVCKSSNVSREDLSGYLDYLCLDCGEKWKPVSREETFKMVVDLLSVFSYDDLLEKEKVEGWTVKKEWERLE